MIKSATVGMLAVLLWCGDLYGMGLLKTHSKELDSCFAYWLESLAHDMVAIACELEEKIIPMDAQLEEELGEVPLQFAPLIMEYVDGGLVVVGRRLSEDDVGVAALLDIEEMKVTTEVEFTTVEFLTTVIRRNGQRMVVNNVNGTGVLEILVS